MAFRATYKPMYLYNASKPSRKRQGVGKDQSVVRQLETILGKFPSKMGEPKQSAASSGPSVEKRLENLSKQMSHLKREQQQQVVNAYPLNAFGNSSGFLYGDPAYTVRVHLQGPFKGAIITPQMQAFNSAISTVRISVEWLFGNITNYFKFVNMSEQCWENVYSMCNLAQCTNLPLW